MRFIQLTCNNCNATMRLEQRGSDSSLCCPYCGSRSGLLVESDRVKVAQIKADTERMGMALSYREHRDYLEEDRSRRRIQIAIICVCALVALALSWAFAAQMGW